MYTCAQQCHRRTNFKTFGFDVKWSEKSRKVFSKMRRLLQTIVINCLFINIYKKWTILFSFSTILYFFTINFFTNDNDELITTLLHTIGFQSPKTSIWRKKILIYTLLRLCLFDALVAKNSMINFTGFSDYIKKLIKSQNCVQFVFVKIVLYKIYVHLYQWNKWL